MKGKKVMEGGKEKGKEKRKEDKTSEVKRNKFQ